MSVGTTLKPPVALILFNRPHTTRQVFAAIRKVRPSRLFLIADGPRPDHPTDSAECHEARVAVERVDWDCEVLTNYAAANLGIKRRVGSGLDWVFQQVEEAIILEDDCLPHESFFQYCEELLARFRDDARILTISGNCYDPEKRFAAASYSFSRYPLIWGWATWHRAWAQYDPAMERWPELLEEHWLEQQLQDPNAARYWSYIFQMNYEKCASGDWDYAWVLSSWRHDGLSIVPSANLVSNIGFGAGASHTHDAQSQFSNLPLEAMRFPMTHPGEVTRNLELDDWIEKRLFSGNLSRLFAFLRNRLSRPVS
jgi:hypothetical protein